VSRLSLLYDHKFGAWASSLLFLQCTVKKCLSLSFVCQCRVIESLVKEKELKCRERYVCTLATAVSEGG